MLYLGNEKKSNIHSKPAKAILYFQDPPPTLTGAPHFENLTYFYRKRARLRSIANPLQNSILGPVLTLERTLVFFTLFFQLFTSKLTHTGQIVDKPTKVLAAKSNFRGVFLL